MAFLSTKSLNILTERCFSDKIEPRIRIRTLTLNLSARITDIKNCFAVSNGVCHNTTSCGCGSKRRACNSYINKKRFTLNAFFGGGLNETEMDVGLILAYRSGREIQLLYLLFRTERRIQSRIDVTYNLSSFF